MKTWTLSLALALVGAACQPKEEGKPSEELPGGEETGIEDTDTGAEDTDTAEDTAEETVESVTCTPDDLEFRVEARDANGMATESFTPEDMPMLAGIVTNPCDDGHVSMETTSTCLVELWTITPPEGEVIEIRPVCDATPTTWRVKPARGEEATYKMESVVPGDYDVEVRFAYGSERAETSFTVEEPVETPEETP